MAADTRRDVELHIRARDYSRKTIDEVTASLDRLVKQQDDQLDAAKRGEVGLKALEAAYGRLEDAGKALLAQNAVIETFNAQSRALEEVKARVEEARRAHEQYAAELAGAESPTKKQTQQLNRYATAVRAAERAQANAEKRVATAEANMARLGISSDQAEAAQGRLVLAVQEVNRALEAQDKAIGEQEAENAAQERETAAKRRADALHKQREAEVNQIWQVALAERDAIEQANAAEAKRRAELDKSAASLDGMVTKYNELSRAAVNSLAQSDRPTTGGDSVSALQQAEAAYERQMQVVRRLREDYRITRAQARELAEQMRNGTISSDDAAAKMDIVSRTLAGTTSNFQAATRAARDNRAEVNRASEAVKKEAAARESQRAAVLRAADDAEVLSRKYSELARAGDEVGKQGLQDAIKSIIDPAAEAAKTIDGLEKNVDSLVDAVGKINGPIRGYREMVDGMSTSMKTATTIAGQIDGYRAQIDALAAARREYVSAREAVTNLVQQMREAGAPTAELTQQMNTAQSRLKQAATQMQQVTQRTREMRQGLRDAGVDTRNLTGEEARLTQQAQRLHKATTDLTAAYHKNGAAADGAGNSLNRLLRGQRTTLSYMQRMRGELLSLAAGYMGLNAAIGLASSTIETYRSDQGIESRLAVMVGNDADKIRQEWEYLEGQADRLGFVFGDLATSYSRFGIAASAAGMTQNETRVIFEGISEGAVVAKMSTDDFNGSMRALEQMMSKGQITAEELRQQLGDRLPGAMQMAARGAGMTVAEFSKMMELGQISSRFVINLANEMRQTVAGRLDESLNDLPRIEARFQNALENLRREIGRSGFLEAYTDMILKLTEMLQTDEMQRFAQNVSAAFEMVVRALMWAAENTDLLKMAFGALIAVNLVRVLASMHRSFMLVGSGIAQVATALAPLRAMFMTTTAAAAATTGAMATGAATAGAFSKSLGILLAAFKALARFIPVIGVAIGIGLAGWDLYKAMSADAEEAGAEAGKAYGEAMAKATATELEDPSAMGNRGDLQLAAIEKTLNQEMERTRKADIRTRMKTEKADLDARLEIVSEGYETMKEMARNSGADQAKIGETINNIEKGRLAALAVERQKFENEQAAAASRGGAKRVSIARQVADELSKIEDQLARDVTAQDVGATFERRLQTRLAAVSHEYDKLRQKIEQLARTDKAAAAEAGKRLDTYVQMRQQVEELKVRQDELTRLESRVNENISARSALLAAANARYKAGLDTQEQYQRNIADISKEFTDGIAQSNAKLREFAATMKDVLSPAAFAELTAKIETQGLTEGSGDAALLVQMGERERMLNELLEQRNAILERIQVQRRQGMIDDAEMAKQTEETNGRFREQIIGATFEIESMSMALQNPGNAAAMEAMRLKMAEIRGEAAMARTTFTMLETTIVNSVVNNAMTAIESLAQSLANVVMGTESMSDAFRAAGAAAAQFFAQLLRDIAMAIIRQQILNALSNLGGGIGGVATQLGGVASGVKHDGGVVGPATQSTGASRRRVSPALFRNAPRLHTGGVVGLTHGEVPAILQTNEEVLARDDPRNILNGGAGADGSSPGSDMNIKTVIVDDPNRIPEAMTGAAGERVMMTFLKNNAATVRALLK